MDHGHHTERICERYMGDLDRGPPERAQRGASYLLRRATPQGGHRLLHTGRQCDPSRFEWRLAAAWSRLCGDRWTRVRRLLSSGRRGARSQTCEFREADSGWFRLCRAGALHDDRDAGHRSSADRDDRDERRTDPSLRDVRGRADDRHQRRHVSDSGPRPALRKRVRSHPLARSRARLDAAAHAFTREGHDVDGPLPAPAPTRFGFRPTTRTTKARSKPPSCTKPSSSGCCRTCIYAGRT